MRVGFVGLGEMGRRMAARLIDAGHAVTVHNRTREREVPLAAKGAARASTPSESAGGAEVIVVIVSDTADVEEVLFGDAGVAEGAPSDAVVVDMSTISPTATREFAGRLAQSDLSMVDAPVSGGTEGAERGTLTIFAGGEEEALDRVRPVLGALGSTITHFGPSGAGQMAKAVNQVIVAGTYLAVAEGLVCGIEAGLQGELLIEALSAGAASSWALTNRGQRIVEGRYPLGFKVSLHRKDLRIVLEEADRLGVPLPGARLVAAIEDELVAAGYGEEDIAALARAIRERLATVVARDR
ncbi:MAG: NAD(P)-dependent oxidoreductase [Actinomycetota bacterium]